MESYDKSAVVNEIKYLLAKVESVKRIDKYNYVCKVYSVLGANKQFVTDHPKFFTTFLTNANNLIRDIVRDFEQAPEEERKLMCMAISKIIETVNTITS
jgi:hypothetical protein